MCALCPSFLYVYFYFWGHERKKSATWMPMEHLKFHELVKSGSLTYVNSPNLESCPREWHDLNI